MISNSNSGTDHINAFEALCQHVRASLGDAVRRAIGDMVAVFREREADKAQADQQAATLWSNVSERIRMTHHRYDDLLERRVRGQTYSPIPESDGDFADQLTQAIRKSCPDEFATVICAALAFRPNIGQTSATHPLDASVIAFAFTAAVSDVIADPGFSLPDESELVQTLALQIAEVYRSAAHTAGSVSDDGALDDSGLPIGYDERQSVAAPTAPTVPEPKASSEQIHTAAKIMTPSEPDPEKEKSAPTPYTDQALWANYGGRELGQSVLAQSRVGSGLSLVSSLHPVADMERDAQQFAHAVGELAYSRECRAQFFGQIRENLAAADAVPTQLALVDLVNAMFNYAIDDRRLTDSAKPLVWRLQQPVLMLTLLDSAYMSDARRSLRGLVENFGAIANAFGDDLTRGTELFRRLETVVRALEIISNVLYLRGNVLARQVVIEFDRAASGIAQLVERVERERVAMEATPGRQNRRDYSRRPGRDQERAVTDQLSSTMASKTSGHSLPDSVHQFLDNVWLRYMRTALLRDGPDSPQYQSAVGAVDELVWSLQTSEINHGRRELAQRIPRLIERLTRGMHEIGESEDEHQAFFDELFVIHLQKLQRRRDPESKQSVRKQSAMPATSTTHADATEYDVRHDVPVLDEALDTLPDTEAMITESDLTLSDGQTSAPLTLSVTETLMAADAEPSATGTGAVIEQSTDPHGSESTNLLKPLIEVPAHRDDAHSTLMKTTGFDELTGAAGVTTQVAQPSTEVANTDTRLASNDGSSPDDPLMDRLANTDLSDLPRRPRFETGSVDGLMQALTTGTWVQISGLNSQIVSLKVAWLSPESGALLFVRHPDARVIAREAAQVRSLIDQGRLRLIRLDKQADAS
jgi:hypothetical protein